MTDLSARRLAFDPSQELIPTKVRGAGKNQSGCLDIEHSIEFPAARPSLSARELVGLGPYQKPRRSRAGKYFEQRPIELIRISANVEKSDYSRSGRLAFR